MRREIAGTILFFVVVALPAIAQQKKEELVDQVKDAIEASKRFLRNQQDDRGTWERGGMIGPNIARSWATNGQTCLAMLALLTAGEKPSSKICQLGLHYIRMQPPVGTYVTALQTMV